MLIDPAPNGGDRSVVFVLTLIWPHRVQHWVRTVKVSVVDHMQRSDLIGVGAHQLFLLKQVEEKNNRARAGREADLREAAFAAKINEEDEGRFYKEVEKALIEMKEEDPELNTLPVKRCFNIKEGLMEAF